MAEHLTWTSILILISLGFLSGFVDATVGGGGLISVPALLLVGLSPHYALGTNKLAGSLSSGTSMLSYLKSGKVRLRLVGPLIPLTLFGAFLGAILVTRVPGTFLRPLVIILLAAVTIYTLVKKHFGTTIHDAILDSRMYFITGSVALVLGFYDGFFGPGTGSFLMFAFAFLGFDFVHASGNAKVLNFTSNVSALIVFLVLHTVLVTDGLILAIGMMIGSLIGAQTAIRRGAKYMRPIFVIMTVLVLGQQVFDWTMKHV